VIERQILTAEEAERERAINVRIEQAIASERWNHQNDVKAAVADERLRCAKIARTLSAQACAIYKGRAPERDDMKRADPHTEGMSDAAFEIESRILIPARSAAPAARSRPLAARAGVPGRGPQHPAR
jgi:hypothetical protein